MEKIIFFSYYLIFFSSKFFIANRQNMSFTMMSKLNEISHLYGQTLFVLLYACVEIENTRQFFF